MSQQHQIKLPSLLDADMAAVGQSRDKKGKAAPGRAGPRPQAMGAAWSKRKKALVAVLAGIGGAGALAYGFWTAWSMTAPGLPTTAAQAVAILNSPRFDNLDDARKDQFREEAQRLFRALPDDQRRTMRDDPAFRDAMMRLREEQMDENAIRYARGQELEGFGPPGGNRQPTEEERKRWEQMRKEWEDREAKMTEEERKKMEEERQRRQEEMRKRMDERMGAAINTGSAQRMGLRTEMFKRMGRQGGGGRMFGPGGGGGRGPGGGGGGRGPGGPR